MKSISRPNCFQAFLIVLIVVSDCAIACNPIADFQAAKQLAKKEQKDILLSFCGYRWWWEVSAFDTKAEDPWIKKHFILFEIKIPRHEEKLDAEQKYLTELRKKFHQDRDVPYAAILLVDANGRPFAEIDSNEQSTVEYIPNLKEAVQLRIKRDTAFDRAQRAKGLEKAKWLNKGLTNLYECKIDGEAAKDAGQEILVDLYYQDILAEIIKNDPQDVLGRGKEMRERKQWAKDDADEKIRDGDFEKLIAELNEMLAAPKPLSACLSKIDNFLKDHPAISKKARQRVLFTKVAAAIIFRDYNTALKAYDIMLSSAPELPNTKLRLEIENAIKLSSKGIDRAGTAYSFDLYLDKTDYLLDADGSRIIARIKSIDKDADRLLVEDKMSGMLNKVDLLLRLRNYKQALKVLDEFTRIGGKSKAVLREDRKFRAIILRGLNKKSS